MANDRQFRTRTRYLATRGVVEYRATAPLFVTPSDVVLELGCEWGTTTAVLAQHARKVIAGDISQKVIHEARCKHPALDFRVLDAFDVKRLAALDVTFSKVYLDLSGVSGHRSLLDLIALLNMYSAVLEPDLIVVKSGSLKDFAQKCIVAPPTSSTKLTEL